MLLAIFAIPLLSTSEEDPCLVPLHTLQQPAGLPGSVGELVLFNKLCCTLQAATPGPVSGRASFIHVDFQEEQLEWNVLATYGPKPAPRGGHCLHVVQDAVYMYGGCTLPNERCFNDMFSLNLVSST